MEAVPDAREKKNGGKGNPNQGVGAEREKGVKNAKKGEKGIQIAMIRILAMRSNVERVGNLRQHVH